MRYDAFDYQVVLVEGEPPMPVADLTRDELQQQLCKYIDFVVELEDKAMHDSIRVGKFLSASS